MNSTEFHYKTCCINSTAEAITEMTEQSKSITWNTFKKYVSVESVRVIFPSYSYRGEKHNPFTGELTIGFHLKDDWAVDFCKSEYRGKACYYVIHSGIEYIFTRI